MADLQPSSQQPSNGSEQVPPPSTAPDSTDATIKPDPDLDASIEQDIDMNADQNAPAPNAEENEGLDSLAAAPQPTKKETSLREFLGKMDDYAPIVCDFSFLALLEFLALLTSLLIGSRDIKLGWEGISSA